MDEITPQSDAPGAPELSAEAEGVIARAEIEGSFWDSALEAARSGLPEVSAAVCAAARRRLPAFAGAWEALEARALIEADAEPLRAADLVRAAIAVNSENVLAPHLLALAELRAGRHAAALALIEKRGLPHNLDLLGLIAIEMELATRAWPSILPADWPAWPEAIFPEAPREPEPEPDSPETAEHPAENSETQPPSAPDAPAPPADAISTVKTAKALTWRERRELRAITEKMEKAFLAGDVLSVARAAAEAIGRGLSSPELMGLAGIACEEAGDERAARALLSGALADEPSILIARTFLGRVYWRNGWNDLAADLWRSIPVEGPDDYGRHYHLALAHHVAGARGDAATAMRVALRDFFPETREFYIERARKRFARAIAAAENARASGDSNPERTTPNP